MIGSLLCFWCGHKWPRVDWNTHRVGDIVECRRCHRPTVVRCEDCGGPVTLPAYRTSYMSSREGLPFGILIPTPCSPVYRAMHDIGANVRAAVEHYRQTSGSWRRYIEEDRDG